MNASATPTQKTGFRLASSTNPNTSQVIFLGNLWAFCVEKMMILWITQSVYLTC